MLPAFYICTMSSQAVRSWECQILIEHIDKIIFNFSIINKRIYKNKRINKLILLFRWGDITIVKCASHTEVGQQTTLTMKSQPQRL